MKIKYIFSILFLVSALGMAQVEFPATQPLRIEGDKTLMDNPEKGPTFRILAPPPVKPRINLKDSLTARQINMLPTRELVRAGAGLKLDPKVGERENQGSSKFFGNMYLGDIKSNGKFVGVMVRDHEYVDGDRIRILVNDKVVDPNVFLTGTFKGVNIDLKKGFNRIDFEALNEGTSSPNTAQVTVYDDAGKVIHSNMWNLSQGSKATIIVVKE